MKRCRWLIVCTLLLMLAHPTASAADGECNKWGDCTVSVEKSDSPSKSDLAGDSTAEDLNRTNAAAARAAAAALEAARRAYARCVNEEAQADPPPAESKCVPPDRFVGGAATPAITPGQAAAIAVARLQLPTSSPQIGPDPMKNEWHKAFVGYPLWLWVDGATHVGPVTQTVAGMTVSLDADLSKTVFRMGEYGRPVTCRGGGTAYKSWVQPATPSPTCGYTYQKASVPRTYKVQAIAYWTVAWTANDAQGTITVPRGATISLPVGELQAVVVR